MVAGGSIATDFRRFSPVHRSLTIRWSFRETATCTGRAMTLRGFLICVLTLAAPMAARGEEIGIIGDSIGEGLHLASNYPSPANRFNVAIYNPKIFEQIKQMPRGANAALSLG